MNDGFAMERFKIFAFTWMFLVWSFIDAWFSSIPWRKIVLGLPFVFLTTFLTIIFYWGGGLTSGFRARLLQRQTERAVSSGDWKTAKLMLFRQSHADPKNADIAFELAQVHHADGDSDLAVRMVRNLIFSNSFASTGTQSGDSGQPQSDSLTQAGPAKARFRAVDRRFLMWMIENVYTKSAWPDLSGRDQDDYLGMLATLHADSPGDVSFAQMYVERLLQAKRYQDALPVLVSLIPTSPGIGLRAAIIARSLGYAENADRYASISLEKFRLALQQDPSSAETAVAIARCQVFLSQFAEAIETIDRAIGLAADEKLIDTLLGIRVEAIVAWAEHIDSKNLVAVEDRMRLLQLLQVSLKHAPNNPKLLRMVTSHVLAISEGDGAEFNNLRNALVSGVSPGIAHFIHGTAAVIDGKLDQAKVHLELASKAFPDSDAILNNLAYVLAELPDGDMEKALSVSQMSIVRSPSPTPYHYETRGQILFKLGRWLDAAHDLELALAAPQIAHRAHRSLAICYSELGLEELARNHAKVAEHLASIKDDKLRDVIPGQ